MNKLKKHISAILICSIFLFSQSQRVEANPGMVIPGLIATGAALITAGAVKYYTPSPSAPTTQYFNNYLSAGRLAVATWSASAQYGVNVMQSKYVTMKAKYADFAAYIKNFATTHSDMYRTLFPQVKGTGDILTNNIFEGDSVIISGVEYKVTSVRPPESNVGCAEQTPADYLEPNGCGGSYVQFSSGGPSDSCPSPNHNINRQQYWLACGTKSEDPYSLTQAKKNLDKLAVYNPTAITAGYDDAIRANPSQWTAVDTANPDQDLLTAPPFVPTTDTAANPTTVPTTQAADKAAEAAATKSEAAKQAQTAVDNYVTSHPGATKDNDATLAGLMATAAALTKAAEAAQTLADTTAAEKDVSLPDAKVDSLREIDFTPFLALNGILAAKFPFTLLGSIGNYFSVFDAPAQAPVFDIPIVGNHMIISLAFMDTVASVSRYTIAFLLTLGCIFFVVRRYTD